MNLPSVVILVFLCSGCVEEDLVENTVTQHAYVDQYLTWSNPLLDVCFEQPGFANERSWVRQGVEQTWGDESGLDFRGWFDQCSSSTLQKHIRINFGEDVCDSDQGGCTHNLGTNGFQVANNIEIKTYLDEPLSVRKAAIMTTGAHEVGHALGFAHEQNRSDTPSWCTDPPQGNDGDWTTPEWDSFSLMNYCNNDNYYNYMRLGAMDIYAAGYFYTSSVTLSPIVETVGGTPQFRLFARTYDNNLSLLPQTSSGTWSTWQGIAAGNANLKTPYSAPAAVMTAYGPWVFQRSAGGNVVYKVRQFSTWSDWIDDIGGYVVGQISAASDDGYRIAIAHRTVDYSIKVIERPVSGSGWITTTFTQLLANPKPIGRPSIVAGQEGAMYLVSNFDDNVLRARRAASPGNWDSTWTMFNSASDPIKFYSSPVVTRLAATSTGHPNLIAVAIGADGGVYWWRYSGTPVNGVWSSRQLVPFLNGPPGGAYGTPAVVGLAAGSFRIAVKDVNGYLYDLYASNWGATWSAPVKVTGPSSASGLNVRAVGTPVYGRRNSSESTLFFRAQDSGTYAVTKILYWTPTFLGIGIY